MTAGGPPLTAELTTSLAARAEAGYDVEGIKQRRIGRPPIGSAAAAVESVRFDKKGHLC